MVNLLCIVCLFSVTSLRDDCVAYYTVLAEMYCVRSRGMMKICGLLYGFGGYIVFMSLRRRLCS